MWRFEVFKDEDRGWRWRLVQRNAVIVVESSEIFTRRADAVRAADDARAAIASASIDTV
jgi:uncharacterized protein YegP (UPF0339 family)